MNKSRGTIDSRIETPDAVFDVAWSEARRDLAVAALGNGHLWMVEASGAIVGKAVQAHHTDTNSVSWNCKQRELFASGSSDASIAIWTPQNISKPLMSIPASGESQVNEVAWSVHFGDSLAAAQDDALAGVWDISVGRGAPVVKLEHPRACQVLSVDWNKYHGHLLATGSSDGMIRIWDLRGASAARVPLGILRGHRRAVKRVRWNPWQANSLASVSLDMSWRLWDTDTHQQLFMDEHYTEFCTGLDWSLSAKGELAVCSWDENVDIYSALK